MATTTDVLEPPPAPEPEEGPPLRQLGLGGWIKENLFSNWYNSLLTLVFGLLLGYVVYRSLRFVLVTGRWEIVRANLTLFMVGRFPRGDLWRVAAGLLVAGATAGLGVGMAAARRSAVVGVTLERQGPGQRAAAIARAAWPAGLVVVVLLSLTRTATPKLLAAGLVAVIVVFRWLGRRLSAKSGRWAAATTVVGAFAFYQIVAGFGGVSWGRWEGLLLTVLLAVGGILISFPFGVLLALGRRSPLPVVRWVSVAYIELIRGVPLITVLFMGAFVIGFLFPPGSRPPTLVGRALIALVAFTAAYLAEVVRGGLQAVPVGQLEAAAALGLSPLRVNQKIVLPQALRAVIPAIVGQFISLFKDTSLVVTIGLLELLRVGEVVTSQPDFLAQGLHAETLVFVSFIYWAGSYSMSKTSQRLEKRLGVGER